VRPWKSRKIGPNDLIYDITRIVCVRYDVCGVYYQEPFISSIIHFSRLCIVRIFRYLSNQTQLVFKNDVKYTSETSGNSKTIFRCLKYIVDCYDEIGALYLQRPGDGECLSLYTDDVCKMLIRL